MPSPSSSVVRRIHVYGHASASPQALAVAFGGSVCEEAESESDLAIFAVNPSAGIDQRTIENWSALDDFQIPRMVVVNGLEGQELDFEDAVMVANRVFDQLVTPYLVLHGEDGEAAALIRLQDLQIIDYSKNPPQLRACDPEHEELVREFREEYFEQTSEMDDGAFAAGILFPAIPVNLLKGIGVDAVQRYIDLLPSGS
jgi:translation elongation factor EF-G